jgi:hypothetical protein
MANLNSSLNSSEDDDDERHQMLSMNQIFTSSPLRPRALRRLPMFVSDVEEVFSESSFYDSEMDFGEIVPRSQLMRQNAMPPNVQEIPLPIGPAPFSATLPIVIFDLSDLNETIDREISLWEEDFVLVDEEDDDLFDVPPLDIPTIIPNDFLCTICHELDREGVVTHPCTLHLFHYDCIAAWLKRDLTCPLCRRVRIFIKFNNLYNSCIIILLFIF